MRAFTCLAITLAIVAVSALFAGTAFAQAGSTGGTLGNTDKSISGDREERSEEREEHRRSRGREERKSAAPHAASNCKLAGVWANKMSERGSSVWTIAADGSAVEKGLCNAQGHASLVGRNLTLKWHASCSDGVYTVQLNEACTAGSGKAVYVSGTTLTVTFSRVGE
jgi:hypothetical protein